jgi:hypothetical protein
MLCCVVYHCNRDTVLSRCVPCLLKRLDIQAPVPAQLRGFSWALMVGLAGDNSRESWSKVTACRLRVDRVMMASHARQA